MDLRNPAVKRLKKEFDEIDKDKAELPFTVHPLEDNFLEWHFTLQGPLDSPFSGGLYHGRLVFPAEYPFAPPTLMFLTPNGRFQINTKICLSVTGFHPEHWQPAWGVRTMLIAIRDHFTVDDPAAIGSLNYSSPDRIELARTSGSFSCRGGCGYVGPNPVLKSEEGYTSGIRRPDDSDSTSHFPEFMIFLLLTIAFFAYNYYSSIV